MAKRWMHAVLLAVLFLQLWADTTDSRNVNNGSKVRVIVLPHSHEDPGWTHTINEYYHGGYEYKHYGVKTIYDSVTAELWKGVRACVMIIFFRNRCFCLSACMEKIRRDALWPSKSPSLACGEEKFVIVVPALNCTHMYFVPHWKNLSYYVKEFAFLQ